MAVDATRQSPAARVRPPIAGINLTVLDVLRGLAALYVVAFHARLLLFADSAFLASKPGFSVGGIVDWVFSFGNEAVLLFFLISGFCIHYKQAGKLARGDESAHRLLPLDLRSFAWRRLKRLYPSFVVAIGLTFALDHVGMLVSPAIYSASSVYADLNSHVVAAYTPQSLLSDLLMQSWLVLPAFGSNAPLWSLAYEFWFYAAYPLVLLIRVRAGAWAMLGFSVAVASLAVTGEHLQPGFLYGPFVYWCIWVAGAFVAEAAIGTVRLPRLSWLAVVASAPMIGLPLLYRHDWMHPSLRDLIWGCACAVFLAWLLVNPTQLARRAMAGLADRFGFLGTISYSLYLSHYPWLVLVAAVWVRLHPDGLPLNSDLAAFGVLTAVAIAVVFWGLVERRCVPRRSGLLVQSVERAPAAQPMRPDHALVPGAIGWCHTLVRSWSTKTQPPRHPRQAPTRSHST